MASSPNAEEAKWARTAGALLVGSSDPWEAAEALRVHLSAPTEASSRTLENLGVSDELVADFRQLLPSDPTALGVACHLGAAFELGRRDQPILGSWRPVATWIGGLEGFRHRTAETLMSLLIQARRRVRIFAPFIDEPALKVLAPGLSSAGSRGALVELAVRRETEALTKGVLLPLLDEAGDSSMLRIHVLQVEEVFPHLKLLSIDGRRAYIGSANLTWAALIHNVELGVLVDGEEVIVLERLYDQLIRDSHSDSS